MSEELLPCPFCGDAPKTIDRPDNIDGTRFFFGVMCYCGGYSACAHKMAIRETADLAKADAIEAWNRRAAASRASLEAVPDWIGPLISEWNTAYPRMDIWAKPGSVVIFDGQGGRDSEKRIAMKALRHRCAYEVECINVGSTSSSVKLKGVDGWFNTCLFAEPPMLSAAPAQPAPSIEDLCARIKAADDAAADMDYMLDSDDCISVLRGTWKLPLAMDKPDRPVAQPAQQERQPMTDADASRLWHGDVAATRRTSAFEWYSAGILAAERHHGIRKD